MLDDLQLDAIKGLAIACSKSRFSEIFFNDPETYFLAEIKQAELVFDAIEPDFKKILFVDKAYYLFKKFLSQVYPLGVALRESAQLHFSPVGELQIFGSIIYLEQYLLTLGDIEHEQLPAYIEYLCLSRHLRRIASAYLEKKLSEVYDYASCHRVLNLLSLRLMGFANNGLNMNSSPVYMVFSLYDKIYDNYLEYSVKHFMLIFDNCDVKNIRSILDEYQQLLSRLPLGNKEKFNYLDIRDVVCKYDSMAAYIFSEYLKMLLLWCDSKGKLCNELSEIYMCRMKLIDILDLGCIKVINLDVVWERILVFYLSQLNDGQQFATREYLEDKLESVDSFLYYSESVPEIYFKALDLKIIVMGEYINLLIANKDLEKINEVIKEFPYQQYPIKYGSDTIKTFLNLAKFYRESMRETGHTISKEVLKFRISCLSNLEFFLDGKILIQILSMRLRFERQYIDYFVQERNYVGLYFYKKLVAERGDVRSRRPDGMSESNTAFYNVKRHKLNGDLVSDIDLALDTIASARPSHYDFLLYLGHENSRDYPDCAPH